MSKITLNDVGNLIDATTAATTINDNSAAIVAAMDNTLSRDGTTPNQMESNLDMNSNQIINLPVPALPSSPLRLQDLEDFNDNGTISNLPAGGTDGQVLTKTSDLDYQWGWEDAQVNTTVPVSKGGTGATTASGARTNLGLVIGTDVQAHDADLDTWATKTPPVGTVVGTSDAQTLSNKTLTSPQVNSPTFNNLALGTPVSGTLTNCTGLPISTGVSGLASGVATYLNSPTAANMRIAMLGQTTGLGSLVFGASPNIITANLNTPTAITLTNGTGLPISTGVSGLGTGVATFLATPSSANLRAAITDETGIGLAVFHNTPTLSTPNIVGTSTNDNAAAGSVGEFITSTLAGGSATALTTNTAKNITSISLTAGDWEVSGVGHCFPANTTSLTKWNVSLSTTTNTVNSTPGFIVGNYMNATVFNGSDAIAQGIPSVRFSLSATTTIYLVIQATFTVSTCSAFGYIQARRVR